MTPNQQQEPLMEPILSHSTVPITVGLSWAAHPRRGAAPMK